MKPMKSLTKAERRRQVKAIAAMPDSGIDTSDIPELTAEQMRQAVRGQWYRPVKRPVTMRLDVDVIQWLKQDGRGYQTKANQLLRTEMLRSTGVPGKRRVGGGDSAEKKSVQRAPVSAQRKKSGEQ